jgi:hypothetical protein
MALAKRFFPVPRSPVIKMGASEAASSSAALSIRRKIPEVVTMFMKTAEFARAGGSMLRSAWRTSSKRLRSNARLTMEDLIKLRELELNNEYKFKVIYSKSLRWRSI